MDSKLLAEIAVVAAGSVINALWTLHNLHVRSKLQEMVAGMKDYIRTECVGQTVCNERHAELLRRLEAIGG